MFNKYLSKAPIKKCKSSGSIIFIYLLNAFIIAEEMKTTGKHYGNTIWKVLATLFVVSVIIFGSAGIAKSGNKSNNTPFLVISEENISYNITILKNVLVNASVQALTIDSSTNLLYIGTRHGVSILNITTLISKNITVADGLAGPNIFAFATDFSRQILYIGCNAINSTDSYGLSIYNTSTGAIRNLRTEDGIPVPWITSLAFDKHTDRLYVGTDSGGLAIYNIFNSTFSIRNYTHGLPSNQILSLELDDTKGKLYIGTLAGLAIYDITNDTFIVRTTGNGLIENHIYDLGLDNQNKLYLGTLERGLCIYDIENDSFEYFDILNTEFGFGLVDFTFDSANEIMFIAGAWDGLYTFNTKNDFFISRFNGSDGLPYGVMQLFWDSKSNYLFVGTYNGLAICKFSYPLVPEMNDVSGFDSDGEYIVSWQPSENATTYTLQESTKLDFSTLNVVYSGISTSAPIPCRPNGIYYYRVRASNQHGNSAWSETRSITVIHPPVNPMIEPILSPDTDGNYTLVWSKVSDGKNYILEESTHPSFNASTVIYTGPASSFNVSDKMDGSYYYRIKAFNEGGNSSWSTASVSVMHLPGISQLIISNSINGSYIVSWQVIQNANYYLLEEDENDNFSSPTIRYIGPDTTISITSEANCTYYYRVRSWNSAGFGEWSNVQNIVMPPENVDQSLKNISVLIIMLCITIIGILIFIIKFYKRKTNFKKNREEGK